MNLKNKKFIFIVNPKSGKLSKKKKIKLISDCCPSKPDIVFTKDSQETSIDFLFLIAIHCPRLQSYKELHY